MPRFCTPRFYIQQRAFCVALFITLTLASLPALRADDVKPFLHPLFTDNMVLQRGLADPVWGWTTPGAAVTVRVAGKGARALAGADGKWLASLPPLPVGGPYTLTVSGPQSVTLRNILVGDVWICSGQSNMVFGIGSAINGPAEVAAADHPKIRLFTVGNAISAAPNSLLAGQWTVCTPKNVSNGGWNGFSAVGYFFGRDLQQAVHVPIGLICTAWSGTPAQSWVSQEALLQKLPEFRQEITDADAIRADPRTLAQRNAEWYTKNDPGLPANWQSAALDDSAWKTIALPGYFQDAGIPELSSINGVVWFRRTFDLPAADLGKAAVLHLQADDDDTTWVNGTMVGATVGAPSSTYPLAAGLLKPTGNVISIRLLDRGGKGGVHGDPADLSLEVPGGTDVPLAGSWRCHVGISLAQATPLPVDVVNDPYVPGVLYNGMISPLIPFGIKGAIWYQGESNAGNGKQYQTLLPTMIGDWRTRFGVGAFPFLIVQLANLGQPPAQPGGSGWAELREAQLLTAERLPKTGLAVAVDIGDANDIHPKNKQEVGRRLALTAEAIVYGKKLEYSGPLYQGMTVEGGAIRLHFRHVGGGLVVKGGGPLTGFAIAGADGHFVWAAAKIVGFSVVVTSPAVPAPSAVRYAWADNPTCNLYNQAGLPASPFRTDSGIK
ncbi:MAG: sialate O-acetylesterase [Janthinobacterium lividum]